MLFVVKAVYVKFYSTLNIMFYAVQTVVRLDCFMLYAVQTALRPDSVEIERPLWVREVAGSNPGRVIPKT